MSQPRHCTVVARRGRDGWRGALLCGPSGTGKSDLAPASKDKRFADPANKSPAWGEVAEVGYTGLAALRQRAIDNRIPFDYDTPIPGLQALDRHTLQLTVDEPRPRLVEYLADNGLYGAVAREVVGLFRASYAWDR